MATKTNVTQPQENRNTTAFERVFCSGPTAFRRNLLSRRRFLTGLVATVPLTVALTQGSVGDTIVPPAGQTPPEVLPRREVLDRLAEFKEQLQPLFDLLAYIERAAYLPTDQINADLLVQLWNDTDDALSAGREALDRPEFEQQVMFALAGRDAYRLACARNMEGFEL